MKLVDVYNYTDYITLYDLLKERTANQSISHKKMPTLDSHINFVNSRPYRAWYFMLVENSHVGAIYLTHKNEVGISILKERRRNGYASQALAMLRKKHKGKLYANINPKNKASIAFFKKHGFTPLQVTYESR